MWKRWASTLQETEAPQGILRGLASLGLGRQCPPQFFWELAFPSLSSLFLPCPQVIVRLGKRSLERRWVGLLGGLPWEESCLRGWDLEGCPGPGGHRGGVVHERTS